MYLCRTMYSVLYMISSLFLNPIIQDNSFEIKYLKLHVERPHCIPRMTDTKSYSNKTSGL